MKVYTAHLTTGKVSPLLQIQYPIQCIFRAPAVSHTASKNLSKIDGILQAEIIWWLSLFIIIHLCMRWTGNSEVTRWKSCSPGMLPIQSPFSLEKNACIPCLMWQHQTVCAVAFQALQQFHIEARGTMHKHREWVQSHCIHAVESSAPTHINCELTQQLCHDQSGIFSVLFLSWGWSKISTQQTHPIRWPWTILYNMLRMSLFTVPLEAGLFAWWITSVQGQPLPASRWVLRNSPSSSASSSLSERSTDVSHDHHTQITVQEQKKRVENLL